jgi:hypothetical protein
LHDESGETLSSAHPLSRLRPSQRSCDELFLSGSDGVHPACGIVVGRARPDGHVRLVAGRRAGVRRAGGRRGGPRPDALAERRARAVLQRWQGLHHSARARAGAAIARSPERPPLRAGLRTHTRRPPRIHPPARPRVP